jgi:AcrR family transcriptional regulator
MGNWEDGMPAAARTTLDEIVAAGRDILEGGGTGALTMQAIADRVGVRAPSLYKRLRDRDELLALVATATVDDLGDRMAERALQPDEDPRQVLARLAYAFRAFAHERPRGYGLIFGPLPAGARPDVQSLERSSAPMLEVCAALVGPEHALDAARTVTAWANGFLTMELAGAFQLGPDIDRAFDYGLQVLARAL